MADDKDMSGVMYVNDRKEEGSKQPDRKGHIIIGGTKYWLSGWMGKSQKDGTPYLSLKATEAEAKYQPSTAAKRDYQAPANGEGGKPRGSQAAIDDEIPFGPEFR